MEKKIWMFIISVLSGRSLHNERIERLWHHVHRCVGSVYADIHVHVFHRMESNGFLDTMNEVTSMNSTTAILDV